MKYKVITTEIYSSTYILDANSEEEAIQAARLSNAPFKTVYCETLRDRDSMHVTRLPDWEKGEKVADVVEKHGK
tara:strand:- start:249 stop:470 length:222 start_codon:yes stop_codon:yes gene_type:complete